MGNIDSRSRKINDPNHLWNFLTGRGAQSRTTAIRGWYKREKKRENNFAKLERKLVDRCAYTPLSLSISLPLLPYLGQNLPSKSSEKTGIRNRQRYTGSFLTNFSKIGN